MINARNNSAECAKGLSFHCSLAAGWGAQMTKALKEQKGSDKMSTKLIIVLSSDDDQPLKDDEISMFVTELSYWAHAEWGYRAYVDNVIDTKKENK